MRTFSEIVDVALMQAGFQNNPALAVSFCNSAINEMTPIDHHSDLVEVQLSGDSRSGKIIIPLPDNYRATQAMQTDLGQVVFQRKPGLLTLVDKGKNFYYASGEKLVINARFNKHINFAYYRVTPVFKYYSTDLRLVRSNPDELSDKPYQYRVPTTDTWVPLDMNNPQHLSAYNRHVNWAIKGYSHAILTGTLSSIFNSKGDSDRGARLYRQFSTQVALIADQHGSNLKGEQ